MSTRTDIVRLSSGIEGLDEILEGGFISGNTYLIRGGPGTGKTTVGLQFLCERAHSEEKSLFISLSESVEKINMTAKQKGFDIKNINFLDFTPSSEANIGEMDYNIFPSGEVEEPGILQKITEKIKEKKPNRILIDGITQLYYLSVDSYQFRKQILSVIKFASSQKCTVLLSSEAGETIKDDDLQFISDGVINLEFTEESRGIRITKFRNSGFKEGLHSLRLTDKGMLVYPKIDPGAINRPFSPETLSSGIPELDELLHGGIEKGTATVISGPTGVGKTTLGVQFAKEASGRGERSVIYTFEEGKESLIERCNGINIPVGKMIEKETLSVKKINPLDYTPDHFAYSVREEVERNGTKIVIFDSISGYLLSFNREKENSGTNGMLKQIHSLSEYLKNMGATLILINEVHNITGDFKISEHGISYLSDNIVFLRYLEINGEMRKAIGVLKKRLSNFEKTLREFDITTYGIKVGCPLKELRGILSGTPEFISTKE